MPWTPGKENFYNVELDLSATFAQAVELQKFALADVRPGIYRQRTDDVPTIQLKVRPRMIREGVTGPSERGDRGLIKLGMEDVSRERTAAPAAIPGS